VSSDQNLPVHWSEDGTGIRWATEVDLGVSSPIVSHSQVILTGETITGDDTSLKVVSVDLRSGKQLWETLVVSRKREDFSMRSVMNSSAGPTPATDGKHIFAYFGSHLAALDFKGNLIWLQHIDPDYLDQIRYGAGSSLVVTENNVIVFRDREATEVGWLAAYDKKTGERQWRKQWKDTCCSYTTPVLLKHEAQTEVVVAQAQRITSFDADTGKRLWQRPQPMNQPVASPVLVNDLLCSASGAHGVKDTTCWQLDAAARPKKRATKLWSARKGVGSMSSPVLYNGLLFSLADKGVLYCFNPYTGRIRWRQRLAPGPYAASLTAGDGKIYVFSIRGLASVVAATPEFQLLAENTLPQTGIVASPAIAGGCLLVRSQTHLTCIEGSGLS
jgi:outer membrane protein assembly factor BamB